MRVIFVDTEGIYPTKPYENKDLVMLEQHVLALFEAREWDALIRAIREFTCVYL
jgi:hypothetical protein